MSDEPEIHPCSIRSLVNGFLEKHHYLGRVAGWKVCGVLWSDHFTWDGLVVVSRPVARMVDKDTVEVTRLCLRRGAPKNSGSRLLGWATRWAVKNGYRRVITYADPSQGHTGVIYRAANFRADGTTSAKAGGWGNGGKRVRRRPSEGPKLRFVWEKP